MPLLDIVETLGRTKVTGFMAQFLRTPIVEYLVRCLAADRSVVVQQRAAQALYRFLQQTCRSLPVLQAAMAVEPHGAAGSKSRAGARPSSGATARISEPHAPRLSLASSTDGGASLESGGLVGDRDASHMLATPLVVSRCLVLLGSSSELCR